MTEENTNSSTPSASTHNAATDVSSAPRSSVAGQLFAKYVDFMLHMFSQHALVTVLVALISYPLIARSDLTIAGKIMTGLFSLIFAPLGIILGEKFREFATPDAFLAKGMMDIFWKKLFFRYGPPVIGGLIGVFLAVGPAYLAWRHLGASFLMSKPVPGSSQVTKEVDPYLAKMMEDSDKEKARLREVAQQAAKPATPDASGSLDSNTSRFSEVTKVGTVTYSETGVRGILFNGKRLFNGADAEWQMPIKLFKLVNGREVILAASSGGRGTSCETLYFFLMLDSPNSVQWTPEFGTCAPGGSYAQSGNTITLTIPKLGGNSTVTFNGTTVMEDGKEVVFENEHANDPSM